MKILPLAFLLAGLLLSYVAQARPADTPAAATLRHEIAAMDQRLSNAINFQDIREIQRIFAQDLEFYHDVDGISDHAQNLRNFRQLFASGTNLQRLPIPDSVQVFPLPNYGAIQTGQHSFCHLDKGKNDCGTFKFIFIWRHIEEGWQLARVVSYGH